MGTLTSSLVVEMRVAGTASSPPSAAGKTTAVP